MKSLMKEQDIGKFILPWSARLKPANASSEISSYLCQSKKIKNIYFSRLYAEYHH